MKKTFTFLLAAASSLMTQAQSITIDSSDVAKIGKSVIWATDTAALATTPGAPGANKTWNFTTATADVKDTFAFDSPVGTPYASQFPNANVHAQRQNSHLYMVKTATGLFFDGTVDPTLGTADLNPNEQMISFPSTMGTTFNNNSKMKVQIATGSSAPNPDSIRLISTRTKVGTTDAWGSITTPAGTFNAIRVKTITYSVDSAFAHLPVIGWQFVQASMDTATLYDWWAKGQSYPVMEIDSSSFGVFASFLLPFTNSIKDENRLSASIFPNPVKDLLHISTQSAKISMAIYDMKGSVIRQQNNLSGKADISVADLTSGIYMYSVTDQDGKTARGTFQVSR